MLANDQLRTLSRFLSFAALLFYFLFSLFLLIN